MPEVFRITAEKRPVRRGAFFYKCGGGAGKSAEDTHFPRCPESVKNGAKKQTKTCIEA
jgi:hypothetical protein